MFKQTVMKQAMSKLAILTVGLVLLQGCKDQAVITDDAPLTVSTFAIEKPIENQFRNFKGQVMPADLTPLSFRIEGELQSIAVRAGQQVKKGQVLAQLDDDKLRQKLTDARVQYELALKQFRRGSDLLKRKMVSQSEYDELTANLRLAEVTFQTAKNNVNYTKLLAPFDGYISDVPKKSFESVSPGEMILSIFRGDVVRVRIAISDTVLSMINPDREVRNYEVKTTYSGDDNQYILSYYEHSSEPAEGSNAFEFWLEMPQVSPAILPGTSASLDVDLLEAGLGTLQGYQVPMTALDAGKNQGEFYVWKVTNNMVNKMPVEIVQINSQGAVVSKGIKVGDQVVNTHLRKLRDNAVVVIAKEGN
ncbi:membrane protein [Vibrio sp. MACH09]|uniref:efflux RND transporter periplasmic adaptor subunit n=1 Tax=Vibrio sp. MACH09 TaxID=3025122 RepID=UPI00278F4A66|nr:efflux RND transporter periplasmic adaptor subunit [Vibrio sp. MACH09]GLO63217.1 membrane protein [Vibrio sp. MACH09]